LNRSKWWQQQLRAALSQTPVAAAPAAALLRVETMDPLAQEMLDYLNESWTAFHAVAAARRRLLAAGYVELGERKGWQLQPGGRYFFTRNMSSLVAFALGGAVVPGAGFTVIGAHTDSPCPKLKPVSRLSKGGYLQLSVVGYGGGLWHTWFDRDLSVAGRVIVRRESGECVQRLVKLQRPILRIPTLAVHLSRENGTVQGFKFNLQSQFPPLFATAATEALSRHRSTTAAADTSAEAAAAPAQPTTADVSGGHHALLVELVAQELGVPPEHVVDFELQLCDTQPACIGGGLDEFVYSGRLDNLGALGLGRCLSVHTHIACLRLWRG
jgi:aspartyl aminopeptidase